MNLEFIKPQNLGSLLMKSSQSNSNLQSPGSYLVRSYLITTVRTSGWSSIIQFFSWLRWDTNWRGGPARRIVYLFEPADRVRQSKASGLEVWHLQVVSCRFSHVSICLTYHWIPCCKTYILVSSFACVLSNAQPIFVCQEKLLHIAYN